MQGCHQISKALSLDHDVLAQHLDGAFRVAGDDGIDHGLVFVIGHLEAIPHPQLQAAIRPQAAVQGARLLGQEAIVAAGIDVVVEGLVQVEIGIRIAGIARRLAGLVPIST